jgi:hypothetical protein
MRKRGWVAVLCGVSVLACSGWAGAADLTPGERAWLQAARPVLQYARDQALPLDIVVQPQPTPGETPVGMAYLKGRCKLVLSMRGNPEADALLARVDAALFGPVVEAVAAHELAHCWRHVSGAWGTLPASLKEASTLDRLSPEHAELLRDMWRTRREEGFADLVGLAWTLQHHPALYDTVLAWNLAMRAHQPVDTGPHDTRVWLRLAADRSRFTPAATVFERAQALWLAGVQTDADH